jgi:hypothetical protein
MKRILVYSLAAALTVLMVNSPADAAPLTIGDFFYDTDPFFGPLFGVSNVSDTTLGDGGGTFTDLVLGLYAGDDLVFTSDLGPLDAGASLDTLAQDLSLFSFDSARLAVTFSLPGTVAVEPLASIVFEGAFPSFTGTGHLDSFIQYSPQQSVPEPGTLLLTTVGLAAVGRFRPRRK